MSSGLMSGIATPCRVGALASLPHILTVREGQAQKLRDRPDTSRNERHSHSRLD